MLSNAMLFVCWHEGHHSTYLRHIINFWKSHKTLGKLTLVLSDMYLEWHSDIIDMAKDKNNIDLVIMSPAEGEYLEILKRQEYSDSNEMLDLKVRAFSLIDEETRLFCHYAQKIKPSKALIPYCCTRRMVSMTGVALPCPFSTIHFTPVFHLKENIQYLSDKDDRIVKMQEKYMFSRFIKHPQLQTIFCLDNLAAEAINKLFKTDKAIYLPDPVQEMKAIDRAKLLLLKKDLDIEKDRTVFLLFGAIASRKGIYNILDAIFLVPKELSQKLTLLIVGHITEEEEKIKSKVEFLRQSRPEVQIREKYEFIPENQVALYFQVADVILATYLRHPGMSGILLLAAAAKKPVLSSEYGLMGTVTQKYSLGLTIDAVKPESITQGLTQFLLNDPSSFCDHTLMGQLVAENSPKSFVKTLLGELGCLS